MTHVRNIVWVIALIVLFVAFLTWVLMLVLNVGWWTLILVGVAVGMLWTVGNMQV